MPVEELVFEEAPRGEIEWGLCSMEKCLPR